MSPLVYGHGNTGGGPIEGCRCWGCVGAQEQANSLESIAEYEHFLNYPRVFQQIKIEQRCVEMWAEAVTRKDAFARFGYFRAAALMKALQETGRAVDFFDGLQIGLEAWRWPEEEKQP